MPKKLCLAVGFALVLAAAGPSRAADEAAARAVVDKAIQAHGGEATLAKFPASTIQLKGTIQQGGMPLAFTAEVASQGMKQQRIGIEFEVGGVKFRVIHVLNGDEGWVKINDDTTAMDKDDLAEAQEQAYAGWVATLVPLKDKAYTIEPLGDVQVQGRPAVGVKVSRKERRDVNLYFDKKTHLLVKSETRVKDEESGQEMNEETFLGDYKEIDGVPQAVRLTIKRDGKDYLEAEVVEFKAAEKLDANLFTKP